jgi:hypothetical protein
MPVFTQKSDTSPLIGKSVRRASISMSKHGQIMAQGIEKSEVDIRDLQSEAEETHVGDLASIADVLSPKLGSNAVPTTHFSWLMLY